MPNRLRRHGQHGQSYSTMSRTSYRAPQQYRTSQYRLERTNPPGNRTAEIITISLLVALFVLVGVGVMLWVVENPIALAPTPNATPTAKPRPTATPDFRATRVAAVLATQAVNVQSTPPQVIAGTPTIFAEGTRQIITIPLIVGNLPQANQTPDATTSPSSIVLPNISANVGTPVTGGANVTPNGTLSPAITPAATAATVTPAGIQIILLPNISSNVPPTSTPTPTSTQIEASPPSSGADATPTPTATSSAPVVDIDQQTPTPTIPLETQPTDTPIPPTATPTGTSTPLPYIANTLKAFVQKDNAVLRIGPSNIYTVTGTLAAGQEVEIFGRSPSGEWIFVCCENTNEGNISGWIRQVYAPPTDNALNPGAPEDLDPNQVRWLSEYPVISGLHPLPTLTPIPAGDYPLYRYTPDNRGFLAELPQPPVTSRWTARAQAAGSLTSPVAVFGSSVIVASADNHLYSFDRDNGNQRWRFNVGAPISVAPMVHQSLIYVATDNNQVIAFVDRGNEAVIEWQTPLPLPPVSSFNVYSDTLFISAMQAVNHQLIALDRNTGTNVGTVAITPTGDLPQYPTIGDQLIYVGDGSLQALDVNDFEIVWTRSDIGNIVAPPVYGWPGVEKMAELYVATSNNFIYSLDANTGEEVWNFDNGEVATGLGLNSVAVFVSGNGYVKAISRQSGEELWRSIVAGNVMGGPYVDDDLAIVATASGNVQFLVTGSGSVLGNSSALISSAAAGAAAISGEWIFVPGTDGGLYELRESP